MSLFDKITESLSQVSDLFSKQNVDSNPDLNSVSKTEKSNWFADLFTKFNTATPSFNQNTGLNLAARNINLSNDEIKAQVLKESARLNPTNNAQDITKELLKSHKTSNGGYIAIVRPETLGKEIWAGTTPGDVQRAACKKAAIAYGIAKTDAQADKIYDVLGDAGIVLDKKDGGKLYFTERDFKDPNIMRAYTDKMSGFPLGISAEDVNRMRVIAKMQGEGKIVDEMRAAIYNIPVEKPQPPAALTTPATLAKTPLKELDVAPFGATPPFPGINTHGPIGSTAANPAINNPFEIEFKMPRY